MIRKGFLLLMFLQALATHATAQDTSMQVSTAVEFPKVHQDRSVTFRLDAPEAESVSVRNTTGGWTGSAWPDGDEIALTKNAEGVWTVTLAPVPPEFYTYAFIVDGLYVLDPENPLVTRDGVRYRNRLEVPGPITANYEYREVPHGTVAHVYAPFPSLGIEKRMTVYTPPGYETSDESYPVFYLQHGGGGDENAWRDLGRVPEIMDNLIAQGKAEPMIVIITNIYYDQVASRDYIPVVPPGGSLPDPLIFPEVLVSDLIPFVEATYRVKNDTNNRAIAGLSRGGMMTFVAAFTNIDKFSWVGSFAGGFPLMPGASKDIPRPANADELRGPDITKSIDLQKAHELMPQLNEAANDKLELLYLSVGLKDGLITANRDLRSLIEAEGVELEYHEVPGYGHEWPYWRVAFEDFVQKIF